MATRPGDRRWPVWFAPVGLLVALLSGGLLVGVSLAPAGDAGDELSPERLALATLILDLAFVITALALAQSRGAASLDAFGLRAAKPLGAGALIAAAAGVYYGASILWGLLVGEQPEQETVRAFSSDDTGSALAAAALSVVVLAPIAEEIFFRGFFFGVLRAHVPFLPAALACGAVFGAIHYAGADTVALLPPLALLGFLFCWLYERSGSLYPAIAFHSLNNALALSLTADVEPLVPLAGAALVATGCVVLMRAPGILRT